MENEKSILEMIPESLHPQLFIEVLKKIEEIKEKEASKPASKEEIAAIMELI